MVTPRAGNYTSARNNTPPPWGFNFIIYQIQPEVHLGKVNEKIRPFLPIGRQTIIIVVKKGGYLFWEGCADFRMVAYRCLKGGGIFREGVLHIVSKKGVGWILGVLLCIKGGYILGERGGFWEGRK